jgi:hypothetical protein
MSPTPPASPGAIIVNESDHFKIAQAIYNTVTGKTEKLAKTYDNDFIITLDDVQQLHLKLEQTSSQWKILSKNNNVAIHHVNDNKETFSSIERFKIYDASRTSATESIVYGYNILIELPETEKPQPYRVTVRAISRIAMFGRMEREMAPPPLLRFFGHVSLIIEIEYVDYNVARNILSAVTSWVDAIERNSKLSWIRKVQNLTHWIPSIFQLVLIPLAGCILFRETGEILPDSATHARLAQWLIVAGVGLAFSISVAKILGRLTESGIDQIITLSAIKINKGDERLIEKYSHRNIWKVMQVLFSLIGIVVHNTIVNELIALIKKHVFHLH